MMFKPKELLHILLALILFAFIISFLQGINPFLTALLIAFIILAISILTKKFVAHYLDSSIEHKIWHLQRYGYYTRSYFKKPFPTGIIIPFVLVWLSYPSGFLKCCIFLQFDSKSTPARAAKRRGLVRLSEITESHLAWIAAAGTIATLTLSGIAFILGFTELAKFSIYFSVWNLIPIGQLDGTKILFGNKILWLILTTISIILFLYTLLI